MSCQNQKGLFCISLVLNVFVALHVSRGVMNDKRPGGKFIQLRRLPLYNHNKTQRATHTHTHRQQAQIYFEMRSSSAVWSASGIAVHPSWLISPENFLGSFFAFPALDTCWSLCDDTRWCWYWSLWGNWDQRLHCFSHGLLRTNKNDRLARSGSSEEAFWTWRKTNLRFFYFLMSFKT